MIQQPLTIDLLPIELTNGNEGQRKSWQKAARERRQTEQLIAMLGLLREPYGHPVRLVVVRVLGKGQRLWDVSSGLRGNWKQIQDSLVSCGWLHDDSPRWITRVDFEQDGSRREDGPAVEIKVFDSTVEYVDPGLR